MLGNFDARHTESENKKSFKSKVLQRHNQQVHLSFSS